MKRRILRWTLSKKIFIWVLLCFAIIDIVHLKLDVQNQVNNILNEMQQDDSKIYSIARDFYQNYNDIQDKAFLESLAKNDNYGVQLIDKNLKPIDKKTYMGEDYDKKILVLSDYDQGYETCYIVDLSSVDEELLEAYQVSIEGEQIDSASQKVKIAFTKSQDITSQYNYEKEEIKTLEIKEIDYLQINHHILIDKHVADKKIIEPTFKSYNAPSYSTNQGSYAGNFTAVNYNHERDILLSELRNGLDTHYQIFPVRSIVSGDFELGASYKIRFVLDENLYAANVLPLFTKDVPVDEHDNVETEDIIGYIMDYRLSPNSVPFISDNVMKEKIWIYFISFVFAIQISFILSYMITRRVKKMNIATKQISENYFNVHLKESPHDELGELSENINVMNEHLKENMGQLTDEIEHVKKLESVRKEFVANFTHEIKTPLGIINGYIELMEEIKDEEKKAHYLSAINKETDRINELVLAMLNLTRLESENVELKIQDIDIEDLITSTIDSFDGLLEKKKIKINLKGQSELIKADVFQIQLVLKNFISNAIKHTLENGIITILIDYDKISIENEGTHLTSQQMKNIWETYVSSDREGTGLGLAICRTVLDLHGFKYRVDNTISGVRFTFTTRRED